MSICRPQQIPGHCCMPSSLANRVFGFLAGTMIRVMTFCKHRNLAPIRTTICAIKFCISWHAVPTGRRTMICVAKCCNSTYHCLLCVGTTCSQDFHLEQMAVNIGETISSSSEKVDVRTSTVPGRENRYDSRECSKAER